jgi:hypothetical protein
MPLGKFQEGLRLCEGVSLGPAQINAFLGVLKQLEQVARAGRFSYEGAPCAARFLSSATAEAVFS